MGKYFKLFDTINESIDAYFGSSYKEPWVSFTLEDSSVAFNHSMEGNPYDYVDLGLPSGTLWATYNIGATSPEQFGSYFAWGETSPKSTYTDANYQLSTKYTALDGLTVLEPSDDAAVVQWGNGWRMATVDEYNELLAWCTSSWTTYNGVQGLLLTSKINGDEIFFPAAGAKDNDGGDTVGGLFTWYANVNSSNTSEAGSCVCNPDWGLNTLQVLSGPRYGGLPVRAVNRNKKFRYEFVDLGLSSGTLWATCNIGASSPDEFGNYYAWGETTPKTEYTWNNYRYYSNNSVTKYNSSDGKTVLDLSDDAAYLESNGQLMMPTKTQCEELKTGTNHSWVTINGILGIKFASKTDSSKYIFIPTAGYKEGTANGDLGEWFIIWTSNRDSSNSDNAWSFAGLYNDDTNLTTFNYSRQCGKCIRGVVAPQSP